MLCTRTLGLGLGAVASLAFSSGHHQRVPCTRHGPWFTTGSCVPPGWRRLGPHHANSRGRKDASSLSNIGQHQWCARGGGFWTDPVTFGKNRTCDRR